MLSGGNNGSHRSNAQSHLISHSLAAAPSPSKWKSSYLQLVSALPGCITPVFSPLQTSLHRFRTQAFEANPRQTRPGLIPCLRLRLASNQQVLGWRPSRGGGQTQPVIDRNDATPPSHHSWCRTVSRA
ncbi:hypothetical protein CGRA01v4_00302 [Colletotrichum graminicola]|nr:hypothetical protein CGRA01v4_00302 [Colletotrichum graminicola]